MEATLRLISGRRLTAPGRKVTLKRRSRMRRGSLSMTETFDVRMLAGISGTKKPSQGLWCGFEMAFCLRMVSGCQNMNRLEGLSHVIYPMAQNQGMVSGVQNKKQRLGGSPPHFDILNAYEAGNKLAGFPPDLACKQRKHVNLETNKETLRRPSHIFFWLVASNASLITLFVHFGPAQMLRER